MKTKTIMVMVTEDFKERVRKAANHDNKSLSAYVIDCLLVDLKKRKVENIKSFSK